MKKDLHFNPASYSTQFKILGGCVDDAVARKQQQYKVVTDVETATGIIEARGRTGEPRPMPQVSTTAGARSMGSGWAGFHRSMRSGVSASSDSRPLSSNFSAHSDDAAVRAVPVRSVEVPVLPASALEGTAALEAARAREAAVGASRRTSRRRRSTPPASRR